MGTLLTRVRLSPSAFGSLPTYTVPAQARRLRRFLVSGKSAPLPRLNIEFSGNMTPLQYVFDGVILSGLYGFTPGRISEQWQWVGKELEAGTVLKFHIYGAAVDVLLEFET